MQWFWLYSYWLVHPAELSPLMLPAPMLGLPEDKEVEMKFLGHNFGAPRRMRRAVFLFLPPSLLAERVLTLLYACRMHCKSRRKGGAERFAMHLPGWAWCAGMGMTPSLTTASFRKFQGRS